jgi:hypothetical protein
MAGSMGAVRWNEAPRMLPGYRYLLEVAILALLVYGLLLALPSEAGAWTIPDTDQILCFDSLTVMDPPSPGTPFHGQDAQYPGLPPWYSDNGYGTVTDLNTGLMWVQSLPPEKMTWDEAVAGADTCAVGGYADWRLPTIRELYSLIQFSGTDPSGPDPVDPVPFIDTGYFEFEYGDTLAGERLIDAQYWSSTVYQGLTMAGDSTAFGVNFADGRIKGYPSEEVGPPWQPFLMTGFVRYVRGAPYGWNQFQDNGDGTVTDLATGLVWQQADDGVGRNWRQALEYAEALVLGGHDDWRLPDAHELQGIVDYSRSPQATGSPAIDPVFCCTPITDEGGGPNYGFYWTGTTHQASADQQGSEGAFAVYVCFGEALGWMMTPDSTYVLQDVHGAGAQRSDPKAGDPAQYPHGHGPQGDVVRIYNFVRCVRSSGTGVGEGEGGTSPALSLRIIGGNPISGSASLEFFLPASGCARLTVFDVTGRRIAVLFDGWAAAGTGTASWDAEGCPSGVYACVLQSDGAGAVARLALVR